jgi:putative tryptophan/tyrosine transport system substrate-binding protein
MKRRDLLTLIAATLAAPFAVRAQQTSVPLIGFLSSRSPEDAAPHTAAFLAGLRSFGYVDGSSVRIEWRWARGDYDRLPALAGEIIALQPAVVVAAGGTPSARAAKAVTSSIPVLFVTSAAVEGGLVASLSRPGANVTGVDLMTGSLGGKRLEILIQLVPNAATIGFLVNPGSSNVEAEIQDVVEAAGALGRPLVVVRASTEAELALSFSTLADRMVGALIVENDPAFDSMRDRIMTLAAQHRLPAIYHIREAPAAGGLISYGPSLVEAYRQLGLQTSRVLRGANIAELPVLRPTIFELVINARTAASLGLVIPPSLYAHADEVIE